MKEFTIRLPDEVFDTLNQMQNKGAFVRNLIEKELRSSSGESRGPEQKPGDLNRDIRDMNERLKQVGHKVDRVYSMLNMIQNNGAAFHGMVDEVEDGELQEITSEGIEGAVSEEDDKKRLKELENSILMYIPPGSDIKCDIIKNLLSKRYDNRNIEYAIKQMISSGSVCNVAKDGFNYLKRP